MDNPLNLLPGTEVSARGLRWEIVATQNLGQQTLFRLRGVEHAVLGQEFDLLYPFEAVQPVRHDLQPERDRAAPLANWLVYHQAFLLEQALGPTAFLAVQPGRLRIEPYQLVPVLRAVQMSRTRLLLADGVGLGKTIQAGLVITELIARRLAHRVLVVSPAGPLLEQWRLEMSQRFGLRLEEVNRQKLEEIRRGTELGSNPFDHVPLALVSVDCPGEGPGDGVLARIRPALAVPDVRAGPGVHGVGGQAPWRGPLWPERHPHPDPSGLGRTGRGLAPGPPALDSPRLRGQETRQRVDYGPLDVEDLGRVYEALLELDPGISSEPMCRLRRQKLEVVVPMAQGEKYRRAGKTKTEELAGEEPEDSTEEEAEEEQPTRGKKTKVDWIEAIPPGRFYLRVGLGRKATGSYYTPHSFVRFLVQETLGPQVAERSPPNDPQPVKILQLKVLDPAMGSGHFLVEACRFLGDKLYEAVRLCDDKALTAERRAEKGTKAEREKALAEAGEWRQRILDIPDPDGELVKYLPSRSPEGEESGFSQRRAEALCRRLVATHCLYGVDKNPLAVELAKLALWLESHAEGMPLTFLDHRLVVGDSLTGPFWERLIFRPGNPKEPIENLFSQGLNLKLIFDTKNSYPCYLQ